MVDHASRLAFYTTWLRVDDLTLKQVAYLWAEVEPPPPGSAAEAMPAIVAAHLQMLKGAIATGKLRIDDKSRLVWRGDLKEFAKARDESPAFLFGPPPLAPNQTVASQLKGIISLGSPLMLEAEKNARNMMATQAEERAEAREAERRAELRAAEVPPELAAPSPTVCATPSAANVTDQQIAAWIRRRRKYLQANSENHGRDRLIREAAKFWSVPGKRVQSIWDEKKLGLKRKGTSKR